jgi:hypothetical protein
VEKSEEPAPKSKPVAAAETKTPDLASVPEVPEKVEARREDKDATQRTMKEMDDIRTTAEERRQNLVKETMDMAETPYKESDAASHEDTAAMEEKPAAEEVTAAELKPPVEMPAKEEMKKEKKEEMKEAKKEKPAVKEEAALPPEPPAQEKAEEEPAPVIKETVKAEPMKPAKMPMPLEETPPPAIEVTPPQAENSRPVEMPPQARIAAASPPPSRPVKEEVLTPPPVKEMMTTRENIQPEPANDNAPRGFEPIRLKPPVAMRSDHFLPDSRYAAVRRMSNKTIPADSSDPFAY